MRRRRSDLLIALLLAAALGAAFWVPALPAGRGWWPVPLDDVFIHFDYARAIAQGSPGAWIAGQGYSSGETAPLYALALALGWLIGFRAQWLGVWAAMIALGSVGSLLGSVRRLLAPLPGWVAWPLALSPFAIGLVDWSMFSGMEVALFCAVLGRALEALAETRAKYPHPTRTRTQWRLGLWGIPLVLLRPEAVVVIAVFAVVAARGAGRRSGFLALLRASVPGAMTTGLVAALNYAFTHDARSAGAALKLLSSNPYTDDVDRARIYVENLLTFWVKGVRAELAVVPALSFVLPLVACGGLVTRRRGLVAACIFSAFFWLLLVSWNGNAPYHDFRYYVPALVLLGIGAALSLAALPKRAALGGAVVLLALAAPKVPGQIQYFVACCANIRDQHVEVGLRVAQLPADARILVGDAGAIPYVSSRHAMDALGLGRTAPLHLVNAAVQGEGSVVEEIESLPPDQRPTHFALYPNWFANLSSRFGTEIDRVTIAKNVIGGGPTKVLYRADWHALEGDETSERSGLLQEVDVAFLASEKRASYTSPQPHGGWTTLDVLKDDTGKDRFDAGRVIPEGMTESFSVSASPPESPLPCPCTITMRIDAGARGILLRGAGDLTLSPVVAGHWREAHIVVTKLDAGQRLVFEARGAEYRDHHIWVTRRSTELQ